MHRKCTCLFQYFLVDNSIFECSIFFQFSIRNFFWIWNLEFFLFFFSFEFGIILHFLNLEFGFFFNFFEFWICFFFLFFQVFNYFVSIFSLEFFAFGIFAFLSQGIKMQKCSRHSSISNRGPMGACTSKSALKSGSRKRKGMLETWSLLGASVDFGDVVWDWDPTEEQLPAERRLLLVAEKDASAAVAAEETAAWWSEDAASPGRITASDEEGAAASLSDSSVCWRRKKRGDKKERIIMISSCIIFFPANQANNSNSNARRGKDRVTCHSHCRHFTFYGPSKHENTHTAQTPRHGVLDLQP